MWGLLTQKAAGGVCASLKFPKEKVSSDLSEEEKQSIVHMLMDFSSDVEGTRGWNEGEFTAGGVATSEIDPNTMHSIIQPKLGFAGELVDVDGAVGGFNLSWGWASGWVAGRNCL